MTEKIPTSQKLEFEILKNLLKHRFPKANLKPYLPKLNSIEDKNLMKWVDKMLDASSLEEIFGK